MDTKGSYIHVDIPCTMMAAWTDQRTPALAIVARGDQIETLSPSEFRVHSQSRPGVSYLVSVERGKWRCECAFFGETGQPCIHILSVRFRAGFQAPKDPETSPPCAKCGSGDVEHSGVRQNKSGPVRRFRCRGCGFFFSGREGYHKRRADPELIAKALDLYFRGVSLRQIASHFEQAYGLRLSPMTVYRWIVHYGRLASEWLDAQKAKVGDKWHVDETMVSVDGEKRWVWNVMDSETRFLLATAVSKARSVRETRVPLHKAKEAAKALPREVLTDGMPAYPEAVKRELGRLGVRGEERLTRKIHTGKLYSPHRRVPSIRAPDSNNLVERLHGSEKDRIRPMRGFDTMRGTAALMDGYRVHYNLVRDHITLGTTPGMAAGLPEIGGFRWRFILDMATRRKVTEENGESFPAE
jgi:transposase-like protein